MFSCLHITLRIYGIMGFFHIFGKISSAASPLGALGDGESRGVSPTERQGLVGQMFGELIMSHPTSAPRNMNMPKNRTQQKPVDSVL